MNWYAIYTKPRWEKKVQSLCEQKGINTYLPTRSTIKQYSDRRKKVNEIVLPGYLFVKYQSTSLQDLRYIPGVINLVYENSKPAIITQEEVDVLRASLEQANNVLVENLNVGEYITVKNAIAFNEKAIVVNKTKKQIVLLLKNLNIKITITHSALLYE